MDWLIILQAGVATGTVLLFATLGEIFAERSGVMNLGVEGMMLIGAMSAFSSCAQDPQPLVGCAGRHAGGGPAQPDPCLHYHHAAGRPGGQRAGAELSGDRDQPGAWRRAEQSRGGCADALVYHPAAEQIPILGAYLFHQPEAAGLYRVICSSRWPGIIINNTRPGMHLRAVGEYPAAADALGINVYATCAIFMSLLGDCWPGWPARRSAWRSRRAGSAS